MDAGPASSNVTVPGTLGQADTSSTSLPANVGPAPSSASTPATAATAAPPTSGESTGEWDVSRAEA